MRSCFGVFHYQESSIICGPRSLSSFKLQELSKCLSLLFWMHLAPPSHPKATIQYVTEYHRAYPIRMAHRLMLPCMTCCAAGLGKFFILGTHNSDTVQPEPYFLAIYQFLRPVRESRCFDFELGEIFGSTELLQL